MGCMARLPRFFIAGLPLHIVQRGKHFDPTVIDAFLSDRGAIETVLREFAD